MDPIFNVNPATGDGTLTFYATGECWHTRLSNWVPDAFGDPEADRIALRHVARYRNLEGTFCD